MRVPEVDPIPFLGIADPISSILHLGGAVVFAVLGFGLLQRAGGNSLRVAAIGVYWGGVLFALTVSGIFHLVARGTDTRHVLLIVDHAAIFFLIAASYTPIHIIQFRGFMRWGILALVWTAALAGMVLKSVWFSVIPQWVGLSLYLGLGWVGLISAIALYRLVGLTPLIPLIGGAMAYTVGALIEYARVPTLVAGIVGSHEIFHLLVLVGVGMHWEYIRRITVHAPTTDLYQTGSFLPTNEWRYPGH
jgi:channel protein (hemolysin III family)